jgi:hypothetical protein
VPLAPRGAAATPELATVLKHAMLEATTPDAKDVWLSLTKSPVKRGWSEAFVQRYRHVYHFEPLCEGVITDEQTRSQG